jgi:UDP-glucose 4-epimerase
MRILVTGGAGFIGSNVVDAYLADGHAVAVLDNLSTGRQENISPQAQLFQTDLRDAVAVERVVAEFRPQVINHHAAQIDVRHSTADPVYDAQVNIAGSLHLLQAAVTHDVQQVVYASTGGAVYGEPEYLPVDERHPIRPLSPYGVSKYTVEQYLGMFWRTYGLPSIILRYSNIYGPRQNTRGEAGVVAIFAGNMLEGEPVTIFGDGQAVRDYLFVGDVVRANLCALEIPNYMTVNICTGIGTTVNDIFEKLAATTHYAQSPMYAPARAGEVQAIYLDPALAASALGWSPQVTLDEGLRRTVDYIQSHMVTP